MENQILAIIPARSGSKSVKDKNIRPIAGKPLLVHSIQHALAAKSITRTIVSTDSEMYAAIARGYGAEVPFLRPAEFAQDHSTDLEVFSHVLSWLADNEDYTPEICVHLRPTYPVRDVEDIDWMIQLLLDNPDADSVRSVVRAPETPFKMWFLNDQQRLTPVVPSDIPEAYNMPRQLLPEVYLQNACIDVIRSRTITELGSMAGKVILGYVMDHFFDIDTEQQFREAERELVVRKTHKGIVGNVDG